MNDLLTSLALGATSGAGAAEGIVNTLLTSVDPSYAAVALPAFIELGAVAAGSVSGALEACKQRLDIVGVCVLALITALGGGMIRDMLLPTNSVYILDTPLAVILCLVVGVAAFFFSGLFYKLDKPIAVFDIISVAAFTVAGADKAIMCGYGFIPSVLMGVVTGVGGGVIRDVCLGRIPNIFKSSNLYAVCSLAGAVVYYAVVDLHVVKLAAAAACTVAVVGLRWLSLRYNLITAAAVDHTPRLMGPFAQLRRHGRVASNASDLDGDGQADEMASWSDTPERRELEQRKAREFRDGE